MDSDRCLVGCRLSHYAVVALIGSGGMGVVYRAIDERLQRDVALKVLSATTADESARRALMAEARVLSRLNHTHLAAVYDVFTESGRDFLVMEYVAGATVDELLRTGPLSFDDTVRLGTHMARGLAAAHAAHVVHRDIKPANLKVTPSGVLKILDFGLAVLLNEPTARLELTTDQTGGVFPIGTVPYMAPEQLRGEPVDERSDIFSAGATLYHMATGRTPFPHQQVACLIDAILNREPLRPSAINPLVTPGLERVITTAMRKDPSERPQSATDLADRLDALTGVRSAVRRFPLRAAVSWSATLARNFRRWTVRSAAADRVG